MSIKVLKRGDQLGRELRAHTIELQRHDRSDKKQWTVELEMYNTIEDEVFILSNQKQRASYAQQH